MNLHEAVVKGEGQPVTQGEITQSPDFHVTYVERRVPEHLTHLVNKLIDKFLRERGYNPEEI